MPEFLRGQYSRVASENDIFAIHKNRIGPTKFLDRHRDLSDLLARVCAWVVDARNEPLDQPALYLDVDVGAGFDVLCH